MLVANWTPFAQLRLAMLATAQPYLDRAPLLALAPGASIVATGLIVAPSATPSRQRSTEV